MGIGSTTLHVLVGNYTQAVYRLIIQVLVAAGRVLPRIWKQGVKIEDF